MQDTLNEEWISKDWEELVSRAHNPGQVLLRSWETKNSYTVNNLVDILDKLKEAVLLKEIRKEAPEIKETPEIRKAPEIRKEAQQAPRINGGQREERGEKEKRTPLNPVGKRTETTVHVAEEKQEKPKEDQDDKDLKEKLRCVKEISVNERKFWVVEGDILLSEEQYARSQKDLKEITKNVEDGINSVIPSSDVSLLGLLNDSAQLERWSPDYAKNLTYFIDEESFQSSSVNASDIRIFLQDATRDWSSVCGVWFTEVKRKKGALFVVRYNSASRPGLMATAFFPHSPPSERLLCIYPDFYTMGFTPAGILRHELGHILGFQHEDIRLTSLVDPYTTEYDTQSVMLSAPFGIKERTISELDADGAAWYYGGPLARFTPYP